MSVLPITSDQVQELFRSFELSAEESKYLKYHLQRFTYTVNQVQQIANQSTERLSILDIGPHMLSYCILKLVKPTPVIFTMGFLNERLFPLALAEKHFELDLNDCMSVSKDMIKDRFDLILFSETIEHLYTSPTIILEFLSGLLRNEPGSGILIQTPNAVNIRKRVKMLSGRNPYELIRTDRTNPGHFREYTINELEQYGKDAGLQTGFAHYCSYWPINNPFFRMANLVPSFRQGITIFLKK
ncbi:MAG: methyltransferase domain-containing protein [Bacteroidota bacterium]